MTVFVYVNTSKQVGDAEHVKVFATTDAAEKWFEENDPEGVAFEYEVLEWKRPPQLAASRLRSLGSSVSMARGQNCFHESPLVCRADAAFMQVSSGPKFTSGQ